ncbi:endonuclease domain-containing protein [Arthrobacter sp. D1-17]
MDPADIIKSAGGVLLTRDVLARGGTGSGIRAAIRSGDVVRVERGLLAASGADPELVAAGRSRGLLTCVSAAPRFGLWQLHPAAQPHYWHSNGRNAVQCISHKAGIATETQVWLDGIGRVDFLLEGFLIVELDGIAFHLEPRQFKKDRRRDNSATVCGLPVLRFFYDDVVHAPETMLAQVRDVLARGSLRWPQPDQPGFGASGRLMWPLMP